MTAADDSAAGVVPADGAGGADGSAAAFRALFETLLQAVGPQGWWPADGPFEMMLGAVLVQHTAWRNAERSLAALRAGGSLDPAGLLALGDDALRQLIRPSGMMAGKSRACLALAEWALTSGALSGGADSLADADLRARLLRLPGVGPETADVIALYAFDRPCFIWDAYARRLLRRRGHAVPDGYEAARRRGPRVDPRWFTLAELREFHAVIVVSEKRRAGEPPRRSDR
jgi:endonuclease-3 related protein